MKRASLPLHPPLAAPLKSGMWKFSFPRARACVCIHALAAYQLTALNSKRTGCGLSLTCDEVALRCHLLDDTCNYSLSEKQGSCCNIKDSTPGVNYFFYIYIYKIFCGFGIIKEKHMAQDVPIIQHNGYMQ